MSLGLLPTEYHPTSIKPFLNILTDVPRGVSPGCPEIFGLTVKVNHHLTISINPYDLTLSQVKNTFKGLGHRSVSLT